MVRDLAVVFIYDDDTNTLKMSNVSRRAIQATLDRAMFLDIPEAPEGPLDDESARKLGALALRCLGEAHPDLAARLNLSVTK
ncbi:hypothetical protein BJG93_22480 [Paraburkholderia sprentiae WSM5005]|uniref:Uncharacterized protein n=1 Tax=Paraburkholderia sprentiae WSM5005 TaxID=754502 RepID=A0A1I9YPC5_9BURK|nr:hypothetical protein [Paraburkholderia sprentiae]APA88158.1 hypothetical protein BJG93_22480 [Paraburkholderia sprentiae WSM5005]